MADIMFWTNTNQILKQRHLTQDAMCSEINISINTLRGWVSKDVLPRADEAVKIAEYLHTSVEYLVTGEESNTSTAELSELKRKIKELAASLD